MECWLELPVTAVWVGARDMVWQDPTCSVFWFSHQSGRLDAAKYRRVFLFSWDIYLYISASLIRQTQRLWDIALRFFEFFWQKCSTMKNSCLGKGLKRIINNRPYFGCRWSESRFTFSFSTSSLQGAHFRSGSLSHLQQLQVPVGPSWRGGRNQNRQKESYLEVMGPPLPCVGVN